MVSGHLFSLKTLLLVINLHSPYPRNISTKICSDLYIAALEEMFLYVTVKHLLANALKFGGLTGKACLRSLTSQKEKFCMKSQSLFYRKK